MAWPGGFRDQRQARFAAGRRVRPAPTRQIVPITAPVSHHQRRLLARIAAKPDHGAGPIRHRYQRPSGIPARSVHHLDRGARFRHRRVLERSVCNPSHILFTEPDYLLAEDPNIGDRSIYHAIWQAVAEGASSPTQIGGLLGVNTRALSYHLTIMRDAEFIRYDQDILLQRRPTISIADPVIRFHNLIVRPNLNAFELRQGRPIWERSQDTFSAKVLGPHFEELARDWTRRHAPEAGLTDLGAIGTTVVACREHRGHEIDVVALDRRSRPRDRRARIALLGEAKATNKPRGVGDLARLEHVAELLSAQGWNTADVRFVIFSRAGMTEELRSTTRPDVHLLDLNAMYGLS